MNKRYLSLQEAAKYLGVSENYLYKATRRKEIPFIRLGRRLKFDVKRLDKLMAENTTEPKDWSEFVHKLHERT